jgi:hypothetical protein
MMNIILLSFMCITTLPCLAVLLHQGKYALSSTNNPEFYFNIGSARA